MMHATLPEWLGVTAATLAGSWLLLKKILMKTALDDTVRNSANTEGGVIDLLREEVKRMAGSNKELWEALKAFPLENVALRKEISDLHETINQLTERLNTLDRRRTRCVDCERDLEPDRRVPTND